MVGHTLFHYYLKHAKKNQDVQNMNLDGHNITPTILNTCIIQVSEDGEKFTKFQIVSFHI